MNNEWQTMDNAPKDRLIVIWAKDNPWVVEWSKNFNTGEEAWLILEFKGNCALIFLPHEAEAWQEAPTKPKWLNH